MAHVAGRLAKYPANSPGALPFHCGTIWWAARHDLWMHNIIYEGVLRLHPTVSIVLRRLLFVPASEAAVFAIPSFTTPTDGWDLRGTAR